MFSSNTSSSGVTPDPQFNYVTMLLHGNGTNGAQNNTFLDSSTNNFTITRNGNTTQGTFTPYGSNWSNYFDGNGDYLTTPSSAAFGFGTGDFTIESWFNLSGGGVFGLPDGAGDALICYQGAVSGNGGRAVVYYPGIGNFTSASVTINTWTHVAVTRSSGTVRVFFNGVITGSPTADSKSWPTGSFEIGRGTSIYPAIIGTGYISNVRVVKGTAVYTAAFTPPTAPLTAITNTSLLTCQSNRFIDNSANNFTITRTGNVSVEKFSPFLSSTEYSAATVGGSAYGAGTGYLTTAGQCLPQGTSDCCVEFWWYPMNFSDNVGFCKANVGQGISLEYQGAGSLASVSFEVYTQGAGGISSLFGGNAYASTGRFQPRQWNHVAYVRTGDTHSIYCNGIRLYTNTAVVGLDWAATTNNLILTSFTNQRYLNGYVSSFRSVVGSSPYDANNTTITVPTSQLTAITNTRLLLNFTNGGIIDNAMMNDLETVGNAQISTSVSKFGGGSMYLDGTAGTYLQLLPNSQNFNFGASGDYTIETWVYQTNRKTDIVPLFQTAGSNVAGYLFGIDASTGGLVIYDGGAFRITATASTVPLNTWTHVAATRSGGTTRVFIDGVQAGSATYTYSSTSFADPRIGVNASYTPAIYQGYLDDFRITKGYARYTANFTPPAAPFPDQ